MSDDLVPERRWRRRHTEQLSERAMDASDQVLEVRIQGAETQSAFSKFSSNASIEKTASVQCKESSPSTNTPDRRMADVVNEDQPSEVRTPHTEGQLDVAGSNATMQSKSAFSKDTSDRSEKESVALMPRDRLRWKRQVDTRQRDAFHSHKQMRDDDPINESAASCAIQGLCPKSRLSFNASARLLQAPELANDFASVLQGGAHHLKAIFCPADERKLFEQLRAEIQDSGLWRSRWGSKGKDSYEWTIAPEGGQRSTGRLTGEDAVTLAKLPAHSYVLERLASLFDVTPLSWWINLYPGGRDSKNFHKDNFGQNITIGASFGATRNLTFRHSVSRDEFHFPQENGDVFAFRERVNDAFLHGMHPLRCEEPDPGPRISVIMMGRARIQ